MRRFAELFARLDRTTSTRAKEEAIGAYLGEAAPDDAAWALFLLSGRRFKRLFDPSLLRAAAVELSGLAPWLVNESVVATGDLAEAVTLLLDHRTPPTPSSVSLSAWIEERLLPLRVADEREKLRALEGWLGELSAEELFLLLKMLTGELRVGVSQRTVVNAIARATGQEAAAVAGRLAGAWSPTPTSFTEVWSGAHGERPPGQPYPFFLASPREAPLDELGAPDEWLAEWKWDGIRGQVVRRGGEVFLWSRGEELVTATFPEVAQAARALPDGTVLDGELVAFRAAPPAGAGSAVEDTDRAGGRALPFAVLQRRLGRKGASPRLRREAPVAFLAFDLLERGGEDVREASLRERRGWLSELLERAPGALRLSPALELDTWDAAERLRAEAREVPAEGLMLKRWSSPYRVGRRRGDWWKWKVDPFTVDAVLTHAQPGHGRRAGLLTDYTLAVWSEGELVPVAKAYSGLTDAEIAEIDRWLRRHARARHGPVREVEPTLVFELAFEGIRPSSRHRAGVALRFPRLARWRRDKTAAEADGLGALRALIPADALRPAPRPDPQMRLFDFGPEEGPSG